MTSPQQAIQVPALYDSHRVSQALPMHAVSSVSNLPGDLHVPSCLCLAAARMHCTSTVRRIVMNAFL